jgi:septation ring formation regulator EzrA
MALAQEDLQQIQQLIEQSLATHPEFANSNVRYELNIRERIVRVEEELKHQRELMLQGFELNNKRLEETRADMSKHFEQVDKRFEQVDKRFEQVDKRFEQVDKRFEQVDKRFEQIERRFEQVDKRFEQVDKRFEQIDKHFVIITNRLDRFMLWSLGLTVSAVIAIIKLT